MDTPLGWFRATGDEVGIQSAHWINEEDAIVGGPGANIAWKRELEKQVKEYFHSQRQTFNLPLSLQGIESHQSVWYSLQDVPHGKLLAFSAVLKKDAKAMKDHELIEAISINPLALLIPSHRIVDDQNQLLPFAHGNDRRDWLIRHEGADLPEQLSLF